MRWVVDGYNVIFADRRLSKFLRNDVEAARTELLDDIQSYHGLMNDKVTIVFDGKYRTTTDNVSDRLVVIFSAEGQTADELIRQEIEGSTSRRSLCIVTNDLAIIDYARICGVPRSGIIRSEEFLATIRRLQPTERDSRSRGMTSRKPHAKKSHDSVTEKPSAIGKPDQELLRLFKENKK